MEKLNYKQILDNTLNEVSKLEDKPSLLLHSCCGPCSSAVLEQLCPYFKVTVFYFNPNMDTFEEYTKRLDTQRQIIESLPAAKGVKLIDGGYDHQSFLAAVKGYETEKEGEARCTLCFNYRLKATLDAAKGYDYFATTLTVSPHKNADVINTLGRKLENGKVKYLISDFKKKEGYKRSIALSKEYNLYRQTYCGCEFSKE